jgi:phenylalanyl-tRNA synthetase alpha chain
MKENLNQIKAEALAEISKAVNKHELADLELKYFGRKQGRLTAILKSLGGLSPQDRKELGNAANMTKIELEQAIKAKYSEIDASQSQKFVDLTLAKPPASGHLHPVTHLKREVEAIFRQMGFAVMLGPEIESDYYNFESLNIPHEHPARDMWDTFYVKDTGTSKAGEKLLLRTHISPMQVRVMEKHKPPFGVISTGRVFRHEATDARHEHTYDYTEGFMVGENLSLANLKFILTNLFRQLFGRPTAFGKDVDVKLRSSYFPFTEPSVEVIMGCIFCQKKGCSVCHSGWLEMAGAGMIHPRVFEYAGYEPGKYSGFAFGLGISRMVMLKYNIPDIRMLYQNDQRLLNQF